MTGQFSRSPGRHACGTPRTGGESLQRWSARCYYFFCDTRALVDDCDNHDDDCYSYYCYVVIIIFISVMYLNSFKTSFIIR